MNFFKNLSLAMKLGIFFFSLMVIAFVYYNWRTKQLEKANIELHKANAVKEQQLKENKETITKTVKTNKVTVEQIEATQKETMEIIKHKEVVEQKTEEKIKEIKKQTTQTGREKEQEEKITVARLEGLWEQYCNGDNNDCYKGRN